ncbi:unnamed protein product [Paramecium primaurelia]|uniref:Uncharacterized protein n=2 Tax=Paramecium TaxID=5884 RepID=A0A8S1SGW7_9CILI|nr:unnamed protein product [Paramecium primaurelia]CAD8139603.1 unnamed protein product [Paramecium pentaurelia]
MQDKVKILMLGERSVGKSSLLNRYIDDKFYDTIQATLGVEYKQKIITNGESQLTVQVWDTAGQERFRYIAPIYYRNAQGVPMVYSVVDRDSFNQVQTWMDYLKDQVDNQLISIILVANKCDLENRNVTTSEGQQLAQLYSVRYFECSAKTGSQVKEMYSELVQQILSKRIQNNDQSQRLRNFPQDQVDNTQPQKCC